MTKKDILIQLQEEISKSDRFCSRYPKESKIDNFIWVGTKDEIIGDWDCHYEFIFENKDREPTKNNSPFLAIEVHLSERNKHGLFKEVALDKQLTFYNWYYEKRNKIVENGRIVYKDWRLRYDAPQVIMKAMDRLCRLDDAIGASLKQVVLENNLLSSGIQRFIKSGKISKERQLKSITTTEQFITLQHGIWEERLLEQIKNKYDDVGQELSFIRIDVFGKKDNVYDIYEVKPYMSATQCIREALGQILYYKYLFEKQGFKVGNIFIAGPEKPLKSDEEYLNSINNGNTPIVKYLRIL